MARWFAAAGALFLVILLVCAVSAKSQWSSTRPEINLGHIFTGEINRSGRPTGYHARPGGKEPATARVVKILSKANRAGVYTARVEIFDHREGRWKEKFSTFFPDRMSRKEVIGGILHAYANRQPGRNQPWQGPSGYGFVVQGYVNSRGNINTAFPVYKGN
jgi:hypothetical protein